MGEACELARVGLGRQAESVICLISLMQLLATQKMQQGSIVLSG